MVMNIFLILMLVFAFLSVQTRMMRRAVIYLGVFSIVSAMLYFLYQAPDVGLAEAVIGSTLTTILYLVALQKYKVMTVYYVDENDETREKNKQRKLAQGQATSVINAPILREIESFCEHKEFEMQIIQTTETYEKLLTHAAHDLIIIRRDEEFYVYASRQNYLFTDLEELICEDEIDHVHLCLS